MPARCLARAVVVGASVLALASNGHPAPQAGTVLWGDSVVSPGGDVRLFDAVASGGRLAVVGWSRAASGDLEWMVRVYRASDGSLEWAQLEDGGTLQDDWAQGVATDGRRLYVAGRATTGPLATQVVFRVRAYELGDGSVRWTRDFPGLAGPAEATQILRAGSRLAVAGHEGQADASEEYVVRALDREDGALLWETRQEAGFGPSARYSAMTTAGRSVYLTGNSFEFLLGTVGELHALSLETGAVLWKHQAAIQTGDTYGAVVASRSRVFVAGSSADPGSSTPFPGARDWIVRSFAARTGAPQWSERRDAQQFDLLDQATNLVLGEDGLYVVGSLGLDQFVEAYDPVDGSTLWSASHDPTGGLEIGRDLVLTDKGLTVLGRSQLGAEVGLSLRTHDPHSGQLLSSSHTGEPGVHDEPWMLLSLRGGLATLSNQFLGMDTGSGYVQIVSAD